MAVREAAERAGTGHGGGCTCGDCPHGAREGHRRALADFLAQRDRLAAGHGLPAAVEYSTSASRQWVSDELTQAARAVAERGREAGEAWLAAVWRASLFAVWGGVVVLVLVQALTAVGAGWSVARTAGLIAGVFFAGLLSAAATLHRSRGGLLAPLVGDDNRLSTSRTVASAWLLLAVFAVFVIALQLAGASRHRDRDALVSGLGLGHGAGLLSVLAVVCAIAVVVRRIVAGRVANRRVQKVRSDRPRPADLLCDDDRRGSFTDVQYVFVNAAAVVLAAVRLARRPDQLPDLPWGLALLVAVSAATYFAGKFAEGSRPVVLSVVRAREAGDLDAPIRTGDDIEIRGTGFVPPGAAGPDRLAGMVVRIGAVHVHVPLVPVPGGFANPTDAVLTVPVPVEVEPGPVGIQVVTAGGVETNTVTVEICD
ncbi:hypothetical protein [Streptomyces fuscigenes]|uniref:hypothetical protein n=1 Tax=Streptomyces fuscigenes TaxID=1528880 RepID=UPI001F2C1F0A|nr:hypothetical protein [Streptomyces fuscigenes]MCF3961135.1 hypothetical protein [Streptomyces fuscigenes]